MNTLEMFGIFVFVGVSLCVQDAHNWMRRVQPWTVLDWLWAIPHGLVLSIWTFGLLYLLTHPVEIQPVTAWQSWVLWFILAVNAFFLLVFLVSRGVKMGRRIRQLGR